MKNGNFHKPSEERGKKKTSCKKINNPRSTRGMSVLQGDLGRAVWLRGVWLRGTCVVVVGYGVRFKYEYKGGQGKEEV